MNNGAQPLPNLVHSSILSSRSITGTSLNHSFTAPSNSVNEFSSNLINTARYCLKRIRISFRLDQIETKLKNSNSTQPKQDWDAVMDTMEGLLGEATSLADPIIDKNHIGSEGIVQVWTLVRVFLCFSFVSIKQDSEGLF